MSLFSCLQSVCWPRFLDVMKSGRTLDVHLCVFYDGVFFPI